MTTIDVYPHLPEWSQELSTQGILITDAKLVIRGWNRWLERHSGRIGGQVIGRNLVDVFPDLVARHLDQLYHQALDGQTIVLAQRLHRYLLQMPPRSDLADFAEMQQSARIGPLTEAGRVVGTVTVIDDVTERVASEQDLRRLLAQEQAAHRAAEGARARLGFLAEAGSLLAGSLDYEITLQQVATLMLPALADYCLIDLVMAHGEVRRVALAHADPTKAALLHDLEHHYPRDETVRRPGLIAIETGGPVLFADVPPTVSLDRAHDAAHREMLEALATRTVLAVPLLARGQTLGAITLGSTQPDRYHAEELALVGDLAHRAALAIDNAELYQQAQLALHARDQALSIVEAERAKLQRLFMQAPAAICIMEGPEHRFAFANALYRQIVGDRDLIGRPIRAALPELDGQNLFETLDRVYATGEPFVGTEIPIQLDRHGTGRPETSFFHFVYQPTRDEHDQVDGIMVQAIDVSEQVQAQRERATLLARAEDARAEAEAAVRMRDLFFSVAAHELKTPLTSLQGNIQLIQRRVLREGMLSERDQRAFQVVLAQSQRLKRMIEALLDVSRIESGQLSLASTALDLNALLQQVISEIRPTLTRHTIDYQSPSTPLMLNGDELRLEQVFQNLIQNAVKYSPAGGVVTVELERQGAILAVSVIDTGIGIPAGALPHLFQRFYRATNVDEQQISGMGIGLYVVKEIISLHGGSIGVESAEGAGSTFTVALPAAE